MKKYNFDEMSTSEIKILQLNVKNEFEATKKEAIGLIDSLKRLEVEWNKINDELKKRG